MTRIIIMLLALFSLVGCSSEFQKKFTETSIEIYAESFDDVSKFSGVYGMWKDNIDTLYIQTGNDKYTNTYLLKTMPEVYSTVIKSLNKYKMKAYALLDNSLWLTESNETRNEVWNILNYNRMYEDERFKGVNINVSLQGANNRELEVFYSNLEEARRLIDAHNDSANDDLLLSVNIDDSEFISENSSIIPLVDKIVYRGKSDSIEDVDKLLSSMENKGKKVSIIVDYDENFYGDDRLLNKLDVNLESFNKYNSFDGIVISNYDDYSDFIAKIKRP